MCAAGETRETWCLEAYPLGPTSLYMAQPHGCHERIRASSEELCQRSTWYERSEWSTDQRLDQRPIPARRLRLVTIVDGSHAVT